MADNRNFAALDWLIHEIGETLKEARQSLEAFVENPKDTEEPEDPNGHQVMCSGEQKVQVTRKDGQIGRAHV